VRVINNTDKVYQDLLKNIITNGKRKGDRTGTGTISIPHACVEFDMSEGFPLLTTKKMFTKGITHELLWFLNGDTNIKYLVDNGVNIWTPDAFREYKKKDLISYGHLRQDPVIDVQPYEEPTMEHFVNMIKTNEKFAKVNGELGPVYGKQWVNWDAWHTKATGSINQIQEVIDKLKNNPDDRRMIVSAWNITEIDQMALPPCHWAFELYTEELTNDERLKIWQDRTKGLHIMLMWIAPKTQSDALDEANIPKRRLSLKWHQRSVDTFLGLPFNIASYALLLHMFAQQTNMVPGTLVGDLTNVHIYKNHVDQCEEQLRRTYMPLPKLVLQKANNMFSYKYNDIKIENYSSHSTIKGVISV